MAETSLYNICLRTKMKIPLLTHCRYSGWWIGICLALMLSGPAEASGTKIRIIASIAPLADFARQVGREHVEVTLLLPPGASPHTYELTPKTMREVSRARIFLKIGAGLEFWAERIVKAAGKNITVVDSSKAVDLLKDEHGVDPHLWLDPVIALSIIEKIERALAEADPAHATAYRKNAEDYMQELRALDRELAEKVRSFRIREYITFHPAWNYFSKRYGLRVAGVIEEGPGKEPSPRHVQRILTELKRLPVKLVFAEPQFSPKVAEAIAREAGGKVLFLDPVGGQKGRETYIEMMRHNVSVMEGVMR